MKFFIAYKYSGENMKELEKTMGKICLTLEKSNKQYYCTFGKKELNKITKKELFFEHALREVNNSDVVLVFLNSEEKSEGLILEVGYALAKEKRIILLINKKIQNTHLRELIDEVIEFKNIDDLCNKLGKIK